MIQKRINSQDFILGIVFSIVFVLLDRTLQISVISGSSFFALSSRIASVAVILIYIISLLHNRSTILIEKATSITLLFIFYSALTTIANSKSVYTTVAASYPIIAMCLFLILIFNSARLYKVFLSSISITYVTLALINLICIIFFPSAFGSHYFLGLKNQIGYTFIIGELIIYLDSEENKKKGKLYLYNIIICITIFMIFSGSNVVGLLLFLSYFFIIPFQNFIKKHSLSWFLVAYAFIWIITVMIDSSVILNIPIIKYIIEDILGKNITLTSRTYIWQVAVILFLQKPWIGHGVANTTNVFHVYKEFINRVSINRDLSAHNQILQSLYEIGIIGVGIVIWLIMSAESNLKKCKNLDTIGMFRISIIVTMVMMMAESPGLYSLIVILNMAALLHRVNNN